MNSELYRVRSHYDSGNPMLQLSLGALAIARRLDGLLEQYGVPAEREPEALPEALLEAILGLIAMRQKVLAKLVPAALSGATHAEQPRISMMALAAAESLLR